MKGKMNYMNFGTAGVLAAILYTSYAFVPMPNFVSSTKSIFALSATVSETNVLSLSLEKPMGMVLEEVEEGAPKGVFILEIGDEGSASKLPNKDEIIGSKVLSVMGSDVTSIGFDDVMDKIINAPQVVEIEITPEKERQQDEISSKPDFAVGTSVTIAVLQDGKPDMALNAKVGDNLRNVLLENGVEIYQGFKQKLGNCGGGGQCTFCAVDFIDSNGWEPRSDYEDGKMKRSPNKRLACLNNIQGPATIRV